jgi:hypothetical protein
VSRDFRIAKRFGNVVGSIVVGIAARVQSAGQAYFFGERVERDEQAPRREKGRV